MVRKKMIEESITQDLEGSHYHGMLNTLANHMIGPAPIIMGETPSYTANVSIETRWLKFCAENEIGSAFRLLRRSACRSGIGIAIPHLRDEGDAVKLGLRVIPTEKLQNPLGGGLEDKWFEGIEYTENYEPKTISLDTEELYKCKDILVWWKRKDECRIAGIPECAPALCVLPSIQRYLDAVIRSAEFRASIPMAVTLDGAIWGKYAIDTGLPRGVYEYEPGMIPTLPPGAKLEGIPVSGIENEDNMVLLAMIGTACRCINMPINLATGDSARYNMASSQVDLGPWKEILKIEREDFNVVVRKFVKWWLYAGSLIPNYFNKEANALINLDSIAYSLCYRSPFHHPDPLKVSNSLYTDLISGATTLTRHHSEEGRNVRTMIEREAQTLGKTYEDLCNLYLTNRSPAALQVLNLTQVQDTGNDNTQKN